MFQFTHPVRGATFEGLRLIAYKPVSIHAPREGCDMRHYLDVVLRAMFQFTHPVRGATIIRIFVVQKDKVSIHAPREGCDSCQLDRSFDP